MFEPVCWSFSLLPEPKQLLAPLWKAVRILKELWGVLRWVRYVELLVAIKVVCLERSNCFIFDEVLGLNCVLLGTLAGLGDLLLPMLVCLEDGRVARVQEMQRQWDSFGGAQAQRNENCAPDEDEQYAKCKDRPSSDHGGCDNTIHLECMR
jgi:hypothetical protein